MPTPKPPAHLSATARKWWRSVVDNYDLEPHQLNLLSAAAESWDRAQEARELIARDGLVIPGREGVPRLHAETRQHRKLFDQWVRKPRDAEYNRQLSEFEHHSKAVTIGSSAGGGYAVPEEILRQIERLQEKFSPVRSLVSVVRASTSDFKMLVDLTGATSGWVGESDSRTATNTPQLREVTPTHGELYAYPQASNWSLEDIFFNVETWLVDSVARSFAIAEGTAVISGNGSSKPTGMLNSTPTAVSDEAASRAAAVYEYVLGGDNSPAGLDDDALIDLVYRVNSAYRANGSWAMNSTTAGQARKLKDSGTGAYVWQPGLTQGQPDRLLGYPVSIWEQMPDPNGGAFPVAFGDFSAGYLLVDRSDVRITVDEVTSPGNTRFYVRKRVGGQVWNNNAIKFLKLL